MSGGILWGLISPTWECAAFWAFVLLCIIGHANERH